MSCVECSINAVHAMQHCVLQLPNQKQCLHPKARASLPEMMLDLG